MGNDLRFDLDTMLTLFLEKCIDVLFHNNSQKSLVAILFSILLYTHDLKQYLTC